jgi:hypothetical protein
VTEDIIIIIIVIMCISKTPIKYSLIPTGEDDRTITLATTLFLAAGKE